MSSPISFPPASSAAVPAPHAIAAVVLAAGKGTRMNSTLPKVMHPVLGRPMIKGVVETARATGCASLVVVTGPDMDSVVETVAPCPTVPQNERLGTGHALLQAQAILEGFSGTVLVLYGDTPLLTPETLTHMISVRHSEQAGVVVLGFRPQDPGPYGRLITGPEGLIEIVEAQDASPEQQAVSLCNSGVMALEAPALWQWLRQIDNTNEKAEYYLTDIVAIARSEGRRCLVVEGNTEELIGVNDRNDLAQCENIAQQRARAKAMANGVTLIAPETVYFSHDTVLGRDVTVAPFTIFGPGVTVANGVSIKGFCHLEACDIAQDALIGPYARLRPHTRIGQGAHIGNFVEIKQASIEAKAKINHLSYIGDAHIGAGTNIGAGTITCNYDGYGKYHTEIMPGAFIGSNTALVAPVTIGAGSIVGAGSVITGDVPSGALAVAREHQNNLEGWADRFHAKKQDKKKQKT